MAGTLKVLTPDEVADLKAAKGVTLTAEEGMALAQAVVEWARTPGPHGGNPYMYHFVDLARAMLPDTD